VTHHRQERALCFTGDFCGFLRFLDSSSARSLSVISFSSFPMAAVSSAVRCSTFCSSSAFNSMTSFSAFSRSAISAVMALVTKAPVAPRRNHGKNNKDKD
jgi:hypothetical protein